MKKYTTIIFSKNRSMQLDLCLRTLWINCIDLLNVSELNVLYKSDSDHKESYNILRKEHDLTTFIEERSFKNDLLNLIRNKKYILFVVDDTIFTKQFSLNQITHDLSSDKEYLGFSLRLGKNTSMCYPLNVQQDIPDFEKVKNNPDINKYRWSGKQYDFGYPLEVSASIYAVKDIIELLENCNYHNPNTLEASLVENTDHFVIDKPFLLCYKESVAFSNPLNRVQDYNNNRCGNVGVDLLLNSFMQGHRIDPNAFCGHISNGAHELVSIPIGKGFFA